MPEDFHANWFIKVGLFYKQKRLVLCLSFVVADSQAKKRYSGGYSGGVPPLPIPNREVKPAHADGTADKVGE